MLNLALGGQAFLVFAKIVDVYLIYRMLPVIVHHPILLNARRIAWPCRVFSST